MSTRRQRATKKTSGRFFESRGFWRALWDKMPCRDSAGSAKPLGEACEARLQNDVGQALTAKACLSESASSGACALFQSHFSFRFGLTGQLLKPISLRLRRVAGLTTSSNQVNEARLFDVVRPATHPKTCETRFKRYAVRPPSTGFPKVRRRRLSICGASLRQSLVRIHAKRRGRFQGKARPAPSPVVT